MPGNFFGFLWGEHKLSLLRDPCPLGRGISIQCLGGWGRERALRCVNCKWGGGACLSALIWSSVSSKGGPITKTGLWNRPNGSSLTHANELFMPEETLSGNVQSAGALPDRGLIWLLSLVSNSRRVEAETRQKFGGVGGRNEGSKLRVYREKSLIFKDLIFRLALWNMFECYLCEK